WSKGGAATVGGGNRRRWHHRGRWLVGLLGGSALLALLAAPVRADSCVGDCDGNGSPSPSERQTALDIALGNDPLALCSASDADHDGVVRVADLTRVAIASLQGCAAAAVVQPRIGGTRTAHTVPPP